MNKFSIILILIFAAFTGNAQRFEIESVDSSGTRFTVRLLPSAEAGELAPAEARPQPLSKAEVFWPIGYSRGQEYYPKGHVFAVHDGDSYKIQQADQTRDWCRIMNVDAPEVRSPYVADDQPFGRAIADSVRNLIKGKVLSCKYYGADQFSRPLVRIKIDNQDLGLLLIKKGWAWYSEENQNQSKLPKSLIRQYKSAERKAKKDGVGLWADPNPVRPSAWRAANPPKGELWTVPE
ncbi:MAG: thermonuclease family protein [Shewanella sp.]